jgi:formylglycine-generating enzyme required for sulfatase activity
MSVDASIFRGLCALSALILTGASSPQSADIHLGKTIIAVVKIPHGTFRMGSDQIIHADDYWRACPTCAPRNDYERPVHEVTITKDFWIGPFDVTQKQWQEVMGTNPSLVKSAGPDSPVTGVSWLDAQSFVAKANAMQNLWTLRLPTEAEWEYAARAGTTGETYGPLNEIAWYKDNSNNTPHPVGQKKPNAFGLYDMLGNVWQWCADWSVPYSSEPVTDPQGPSTGEKHPTRGGCYYCIAVQERAARRNRDVPDHASLSIGFRVVAVPR